MLKKVSVFRLFIIVGLYCLVANFAHPITPTFIQNLHLSDYMFGVAFACMSLTNFLFSPFWGKISRNFGAIRSMGFCFFGYSVAQMMFGLSTTEGGIITARLIGGFFISGISVTQILYVMDNSAPEARGQDLATCVTITAVVSAFGYMVGGLLGDISIFGTFVAQSVGLFVIGVLCWTIIDDNKDAMTSLSIKEVAKSSNPFQAFIDSKKIMTFVIILYLGVCAATSFASTCYEQCFNYFIKDQYGFPPSYNGLLKALVGIISLVANTTICRYLLKKTNINKTVIPVLSICFAMMVSIVMIDNVVPFIIMNVIFFGFNAVYQPLLQAMISSLSKGEDGILVGLYNSMKSLGMVGGSLLAGFVYAAGPKMSFVVSAVAFLIAIVLALGYYLQLSQKTTDNES